MRNLLLFGLLFCLLCLNGCSGKSSVTDNTSNSGILSKPSSTVNTANLNTINQAVVTDEFKDVQFPQCKIYMATLKKLKTCQALPEDQRKKIADDYPKMLEQLKTSYTDSEKSARDLSIYVCETANKALQPSLAKCN